nr:ribonuclease H-like domain-containing protein [Tanacetum cinerariifolium]
MLADSLLPTIFWTEAVATACYVLNRVLVAKPYNKTPYELLTGDKPAIGYLKPFGCQVTILNTSDYLGKFDEKADEGYIVGYSIPGKAYRVYNLVTGKIMETMNIKFLKNLPSLEGTGQPWLFNIDYLTDSLNYARIRNTNLSVRNQVTTPVHDVPNHEEAAQSVLSPSLDLNDDDMEELSSLQTQEQEGKNAAPRLGLAFPTHVVTNAASSIPAEKSSSVSPASTPTASAGNTHPVSPRPSAGRSSKSTGKKLDSSSKTPIPAGGSVFADKPIPADRYVSADKPIPAGRSVSADKSIPAFRSISALRDTNSADRHPSKLSSNAVSERFPPASNTQNSDIHDRLKLFDCPSTGIFSSLSYDDEYHGHDISNQEKEILVNPVTTKKVNEAHPYSLIIGDLHTLV